MWKLPLSQFCQEVKEGRPTIAGPQPTQLGQERDLETLGRPHSSIAHIHLVTYSQYQLWGSGERGGRERGGREGRRSEGGRE